MPLFYKDESIEIRRTVTGPYSNNTYIVICPKTRESVIIDTPAEPQVILKEAQGTKVKAILMTHCHMDHVLGHETIKQGTRAPVAVHPVGVSKLPLPPEVQLTHGQTFDFGNITFQVLHTPGHTPEGLCFLWREHLFSGDTLFPHGPGKTMSPDNFRQLVQSIEEHLMALPDATRVYPGHGDDTVLAKEKQEFHSFKSRPHRPDLCGDVLWLKS